MSLYSHFDQTIVPTYGEWLNSLLQSPNPKQVFAHITARLYLASSRRSKQYEQNGKPLVEKILSDTKNFLHYSDLFLFWPLLSQTNLNLYTQLQSINSLVWSSILNKNENVYETWMPIIVNVFQVSYDPNFNKYIDSIPRKYASWSTVYGPLLWIWIHTSLTLDFSAIPINIAGMIPYYLPLYISCGECQHHWEINGSHLTEFFTAKPLSIEKQKQLAICMIRAHNYIRQYRTGNPKSYSPEILDYVSNSELNLQAPTSVEQSLYKRYSLFGRQIGSAK